MLSVLAGRAVRPSIMARGCGTSHGDAKLSAPPRALLPAQVYNSIRVFITAYVWMTGFGNFSFFYLKVSRGCSLGYGQPCRVGYCGRRLGR